MKLTTRKAPLKLDGPQTVNPERRSVSAVVASENPVQVFDLERFEVVPEVLLMSGLKMPEGRAVPLLDSHSRESSKNVLGSARNFQVIGSELRADIVFAGDPDADACFQKVREGHLSDVSIGYKASESTWIPEGQAQVVSGKRFDGPVKVTTKWTIREVSVTPIGADEAAKFRKDGGYEMADYKQQGLEMTPEQVRAEERARVAELQGLCSRFGCEGMFSRFVSEGFTVEQAQKEVLEQMQRQAQPSAGFRGVVDSDYYGRVSIGKEAVEKRREAAIDGLVLRSGVSIEKPAPGSGEYRMLSLVDLARECLQAAGESVRGLPPGRIVELAIRAHGTSDFPFILAGSANKVLRQAYEESPGTWSVWTSQFDGVDFKEMSRNALSEAPDLDEVPELAEYTFGSFGESKEVYQIYTYGKIFALSRQAIVNDDLGAFTRIPRAWGAAAKRKVGDLVYDILISNANMGDGNALFSSEHANVGTAGAPDVTSLSEARLLMRTQTGLNGAVLNIVPKYLICPAALETTVDQLLNSISLDDTNPGIANPFRGKLEPVVEPRLDADSETAWYLAAAPGTVDTIEIAWLNGQRGPYLEQREGWLVDGIEFKARLDVGCKALDWRGLVRNLGAQS